MPPRTPKHGIPGVRRARSPHYRFMPPGEGRDRAQKNWERFLRNNPRHRPGEIPRHSRMPCLVHNIAGGDHRHCFRRCISEELHEELRSYLDHSEGWHCDSRTGPRPVLFGHPYNVHDEYSGPRFTEFLNKLPDGAGQWIAVHIGPREDSWYVLAVAGVLIQHIDLPPIRGWMRATATGQHRVPRLQPVG